MRQFVVKSSKHFIKDCFSGSAVAADKSYAIVK